MSNECQLGMTILNSDLKFKSKKLKVINNYLFVVTDTNEVLVFSKEEDTVNNLSYFEKRYIILNSVQERDEIIDIFGLDSVDNMNFAKEKTLVIVTQNLIVYYYNFKDGLCYNKINLSVLESDPVLHISSLSDRFLVFIFRKKIFLFDTFTNTVLKEEPLQVLKKEEVDMVIDENLKDFKDRERLNKEKSKKEEEDKMKDNVVNFEAQNIYQIKENSFFISTTKDETYFLVVENVDKLTKDKIDYELVKIRIIKESFEIKKFINDDSLSCLINNNEYLFHNFDKIIKISQLDLVEELSEITSYDTKAKFPIIYIGNLVINKKNTATNSNTQEYNLIVIYKDLTVELFDYDTKIKEIIPKEKFMLMVEDEYLEMKYITTDNVIIGYTETMIQIFDLRRINKNNEKYVDGKINLNNIFEKSNKKLFFTNYFMANFPGYLKDCLKEFNKYRQNAEPFRVTSSLIYAYSENPSIYYIIGTNTGKVGIFDIFFTKDIKLSPILYIDTHKASIETLSIYENRLLIISSSDGMISFTDISSVKLKNAFSSILTSIENVDPNFMSSMKQYYGSIKKGVDEFNNKYIQTMMLKNKQAKERKGARKSVHGFNSVYNIERKKSFSSMGGNEYDSALNAFFIQFLPTNNIKSFSKLKRIVPVILLDLFDMSCINENKVKSKEELLGFVLENNEVIIVRMDTLATIYRFNQANSDLNIEGVYHIAGQKALIFYLSNDTIKVASYATKTCDRYIADLDKIYDLLRVDENLGVYFEINNNKVNELVNNNNRNDLEFDESDYEKFVNKKNNNNYSSNIDKRELDINNNSSLSVLKIKEKITEPKEKELFIKKLYQISLSKRQSLKSTQNKIEASYIKKIGEFVLDKIIEIINMPINDSLQKIKIMNLINNPLLFMKMQEKYDVSEKGIASNYMHFGGQYNQILLINFEDYFSFLEKYANLNDTSATSNSNQKNSNNNKKKRENLLNILSLFHIWNFSLDLDYEIWKLFRLTQPIFDFHPILIGLNSVYSVILCDENVIDEKISNDQFSEHVKYFMKNYILDPSPKPKRDMFTNRNLLIESQKGYLVGLKNFKVSENLSHLLHLSLFGGLISLLGFKDNNYLAEFIHKEKKVLKILTTKNEIKYSSFEMLQKFMFENNDDVLLTNKDYLLLDYLQNEYNKIKKNEKNDKNEKNEEKIINPNIADNLKAKLASMLNYLILVYNYIFDLNRKKEDIYEDFALLTKDSNLEYGNKLEFLSEYELSIINILISYNCIVTNVNPKDENKLKDLDILKITHLLVLFVFKNLKNNSLKISFSKNIFELLGKSTETLNKIYSKNASNYALFLIQYYCSSKVPINLSSSFKKYDIGNISLIKNEENQNFLKIIIFKYIKNYSKTKVSYILKLIVDEFKKVENDSEKEITKYYSYLVEILWLIFKERSHKLIQYLPTVTNQIMRLMSPGNKELKAICMENSKKVLSCLIINYPMIAFHQNTQKLAVGSVDGKIFIYDMTTGSIWKNLEAHKTQISALIFDNTGNSIISYSAEEHLLKCWRIGLANFFGNFFSMKEYKSKKLPEIKKQISPEIVLQNTKFQLSNKEGQVLLTREDKTVVDYNV